jgi:hypothetical protein
VTSALACSRQRRKIAGSSAFSQRAGSAARPYMAGFDALFSQKSGQCFR